MRRRLALSWFAALVLGSCWCAPSARAQSHDAAEDAAAPGSGSLAIVTSPEGAIVTIDGTRGVVSPSVVELPEGVHTVDVRWGDGRQLQRVVSVEAGSVRTLQLSAPDREAEDGRPDTAPGRQGSDGAARIRFVASRPGVSVHLATAVARVPTGAWGARRSASLYERVCEAPCSALLGLGHQRLALALDAGSLVEMEAIQISEPTTLRIDYEPHGDLRAAGFVLLGVGVPLALGLDAAGIVVGVQSSTGFGDEAFIMIGIGTVVAVVALVVGLVMALRQDDVRIVPTRL